MSLPVSIEEAIAETTERLLSISESARLDAELLVARAIDMPRAYLFAHPEDVLDEAAIKRLESTVERRLAGEPMAYISGIKEFWSLELMVSPATLVPRPETELLVDLALRVIPRKADWQVLDLGTGSGAIALAMAKDRPLCDFTAVDVSADALAVAMQNARNLNIPNIDFLQGDWAGPVEGRRFNVIVSNPPYVRQGDPFLESLTAEPDLALIPGPGGLEAIEKIVRDCVSIIEPGGSLFVEHGADQAQDVANLLSSCGWLSVQCYDDYAGLPRVTSALSPSSERS